MNASSLSQNTIFISYSRADWDDYAKPLVEALEQAGLQIWIDQHLIRGGDNWQDKINEALKACGRLVLCVSPEALNSRYVKLEYRYFFNHDKPIYTLMCCAAELPPEIEGLQFIDFSHLDDLVALLKASNP